MNTLYMPAHHRLGMDWACSSVLLMACLQLCFSPNQSDAEGWLGGGGVSDATDMYVE